MARIAQLFFIILLAWLPLKSWSYDYDAYLPVSSQANVEFESQNWHYDSAANLCYRCIHSPAENLQKKTLDGSFFVFIGVQDATKGGSIRNVNGVGGAKNCANCAIATDATLAGNPASALNGGKTLVTDVEKFFGRKFGPLTSATRISGHFQNAGNGARGVVFGSRGTETGHFFNVVNQNGTVRFLDGQTGSAADLSRFQGFSFLRTN